MIKFLRHAFFAFSFLSATLGFGQSVGDTIVVSSLNYNSGVRDTMVSFPNNPALTFEKIILQYNMRCKNALVSTGSDRNKGCGEWDYSCNTYITDSSRIDSAIYTTPSHTVSGFTGNFYSYVVQPTSTFYQHIKRAVVVNSTLSDTASVLGTGTKSLTGVLQTALKAGKSQYLFTQAELTAAGVHAGNIDALALFVSSQPQLAKMFRIRLKATAKTVLSNAEPDLIGFTEVFSIDKSFAAGANRFQFYTPFYWNGTSNLIVEFSFSNKLAATALAFSGDSLSTQKGLQTAGDTYFNFIGSNYVEAAAYKGVRGDTARSVEAWIKTTVADKEIVSWGTDVGGQKYVIRLDAAGKLRMETNGGSAVATTTLTDGKWHHIAVVQAGNNVQSVTFYVDGNIDNKTALTNQTINTGNTYKVRVSRGVNNRYWLGEIEEVRIWSGVLTQAALQDWMYRAVDNTHAFYNDLELYYPFNEGTGAAIADASGKGRNASAIGGTFWSQYTGINHFKRWSTTPLRPNTTFYQGSYNLTVTADTILDTVQNFHNVVSAYQIYPKYGTTKNDSIGLISQVNYWEAVPEKVYGPTGLLASTLVVVPDGNISITSLPYFRRFPSKFEIMSFVTPYGIGLDFGADGETFTFDITDFAPFLKGNKRMTIERGGQWQEELDIRFLFIVGTPPRDVLDIQQIWPTDKKSYTAIVANTAFEQRNVLMNPAANQFKIRSVITGHGQEGEFIPRNHFMNLNGGAAEFTWQVWTECALNPVYPQGGTWVGDRAGWCPGQASDLKEMEITSMVTPGQIAQVDYGMNGASGTSEYIVNNQLVSYGAPNFVLDAALVDVIKPSKKIEHSRIGTLCQGPIVRIQNTGSTTLSSATIVYWVNNTSTHETYNWTGFLGYLEMADVALPTANVWASMNPTNNVFHAEIVAPNGGSDGYSYNNKYNAPFNVPTVLPSEFYIRFKSNSAAAETSYLLLDENGTVVASRAGMSNNGTYKDTLSLANGCYTFKVIDSDGDGINFWANSDGAGSVQFRSSINDTLVQAFNGDFGGEINFAFTVNYPLSYEEMYPITETKVYPNPAADRVTVEVKDAQKATINFYSNTGQKLSLQRTLHDGRITFNTAGLSQGVYYVKIEVAGQITFEKVVIL